MGEPVEQSAGEAFGVEHPGLSRDSKCCATRSKSYFDYRLPIWSLRSAATTTNLNTAIWFVQARDYSPQRLRTFTKPDDIALIVRMGFDDCRLSVSADPLVEWHAPAQRRPS
jgi:hypothetical protein